MRGEDLAAHVPGDGSAGQAERVREDINARDGEDAFDRGVGRICGRRLLGPRAVREHEHAERAEGGAAQQPEAVSADADAVEHVGEGREELHGAEDARQEERAGNGLRDAQEDHRREVVQRVHARCVLRDEQPDADEEPLSDRVGERRVREARRLDGLSSFRGQPGVVDVSRFAYDERVVV